MSQGIREGTSNLELLCQTLKTLQDDAVNIMKKSSEDMGSFYNSVFNDETRTQIGELHDYIMHYSDYDTTEAHTNIDTKKHNEQTDTGTSRNNTHTDTKETIHYKIGKTHWHC